MLATMTPVRGRWGWHPCDYDTFLRIKEFHRLVFRDRRASKRHERWEAKMPHNRVHRYPDGTRTPMGEPRRLGTTQAEYEWVLAEYRSVRQPAVDSETVRPLDLPTGWERRLEELQEFYAEG